MKKSDFMKMLRELIRDSKKAILSTKEATPVETLNYIDNRIIEFSKEVASAFDMPLSDPWEAPMAIDLLRRNKCISNACWSKLIGFFLIIDAFQIQEEIKFDTDLEFLLKYIEDLEEVCC